MKPAAFHYEAPVSLDEALALRREHGFDSVILAGGQSLVPLLNLRLSQPEVVIDLRLVPGLGEIREHGADGVALGAMTRQRDAERSPLVASRSALLAKALKHVAHPTIRNRGTIGGSLAHAFPSAELPAVALALDAQLVARSSGGERTIDANDFFLGTMMTALESDELLVDVVFPDRFRGGSAFLEVARRHGDFALAGAGALVRTSPDGVVEDARLVFTGVADKPVRATAAEESLRGSPAGTDLFDEIASTAASVLEPYDDLHATAAYRRRVAGVIGARALAQAAAAQDGIVTG